MSEEVPAPVEKIDEVQDDYEFARLTYYNLIKSGLEMLPNLQTVAKDSEHPRAFEVYTNMLKGIADIAGELMNHQKKRKDVKEETNKPRKVGSNADQIEEAEAPRKIVFSGSPLDTIEGEVEEVKDEIEEVKDEIV